MDNVDAFFSEIKARGEHPEDDCSMCQFGNALKNNRRFEKLIMDKIEILTNVNPFILMGPDGPIPIAQMIFDTWCMAVITTRKAVIEEIEKGELEVWQTEKAKPTSASGKG